MPAKKQPPSFGEMVRSARTARGWTQRALARKVGCHSAYITRIELRQQLCSWRLAEYLARVLELGQALLAQWEFEQKAHDDKKRYLQSRGLRVAEKGTSYATVTYPEELEQI